MKRLRIALLAFGAIVVLLLLVVGVSVFVAQSDWLREKVRTTIVAELEKATGGKVEIGRFQFDWKTLNAELDHLVIHGKEAAGEAPLLVVDRVLVGFKIISLISREFDLANISVEHPQVHLIQYAGGGTNVPEPKVKRTSSKPVPETILDLKIKKFDLKNGFLLVESPGNKGHVSPFQTKAENLAARVQYEALMLRYSGDLSVSPLHFETNLTGPVDLQIQASAAFEKDRLSVSKASIATPASTIDIANGLLDSFHHPVLTADVRGHVSLVEVGRIFRLKTYQSGTASVEGNLRAASATDYKFQGHVHSNSVSFRFPPDVFALQSASVDSRVLLIPDNLEFEGAKVATLGGTVTGSMTIRGFDRFSAKGEVKNIAARAGAATFTKFPIPYDAIANGTFDVSGSFKNVKDVVLTGKASLSPVPNSLPVTGAATVKYDGPSDDLSLVASYAVLPHSRVDVEGVINRHLNVKASSTSLSDLEPVWQQFQVTVPITLKNGSLAFQGSVDGPFTAPVIEGHGEARNAIYEQQPIEAASADLKIQSSSLAVRNARLTADNLTGQGDATVAMQQWKVSESSAIQGHLSVNEASIAQVLTLLQQKDVPITGTATASGTFSGTIANPRIVAEMKASRGTVGPEQYDSMTAHIDSPGKTSQTASIVVNAGQKHANIKATFDHGAATALPGTLSFHVDTNRIAINQIAQIRKDYPDVNAYATLKADGTVAISQTMGKDAKGLPASDTHYRFSRLDGNLTINGLEAAGRALGNAEVTAVTRDDVMTAHISSDVAQASVRGDATIRLAGDYPIQSRVAIAKVDLNTALKLANPQISTGSFHFTGLTEATVTLNGPLAKRDQLTGTIEVPRLELQPLPITGAAPSLKAFVLKNSGTLRATLSKSALHLNEVRFEAPSTNVAISGAVALDQNAPLDLRAQGNINLQLLDGFSQDITSTGALVVNAALRGTFTNPDFSGRAELQGGDFHVLDLSNGLTNANGVFLFNGSRATIQTLSAESGGGKVSATGFLALTKGLFAFNLDARANQVRVRYPEGVSTVADANITLAGTSQHSQASGKVLIRRLTINPKSGASGVLAKSAEPVKTPSTSTGLLSNLNLDVQIETSPDVAFQTSLAQTVQAEASLRLRGTAASPALLGRVNVTEGEIVFFGNKYTVTQGTISFFNPVKIEPVLNVDLETKARGVQIVITVSGPLDKPLNVTYRSDPPLQFSDIVSLLATGRSPTDPSIALRDTTGNQSLQQMGASALLGTAIANPVSGRLQRFFGVSKLKIDPQLSGITGSPQARLTIEQQVTPDILFTYITDVSSTSTQLIRVEWSLNKNWSAIATREENGYVGLDFAYKKRFK